MLIDEVKIKVKAGDGGDGVVRFSKLVKSRGPTGGDGGKGGDVILKGVSDLGALRQFKSKKDIRAKNGIDGSQNKRSGSSGEDAVISVPVGTAVYDITNNKFYDIIYLDQEEIVAKGGKGGFGNFRFRSSRNTTPTRANKGLPGEEIELKLELKLIADIGFIGLPNVGKSSLLNELTNASSKIANYKFTTLEPHLGVYNNLVLADIPGLIEGASDGKGLGHKFLRHIERTRILFHLIAADSIDPVLDYKIIRNELRSFKESMLKKDEWVIISKSDEVDDVRLEEIKNMLKKYNSNVLTVSLLKDDGLLEVRKALDNVELMKKNIDL